mgnify:CR=1 FL=1
MAVDISNRKKNGAAISVVKGCSFVFAVEGQEIVAWFSSISGLEKIFVDGALVSLQRNFSKDSNNYFTLGENEYSINLHVVSLFSGPFVCSLKKNSLDYRRQKLVFPQPLRSLWKLLLLTGLPIFIIFAALIAHFSMYGVPLQDHTYYFFIALALLAFPTALSLLGWSKPVIEVVDDVAEG